MAQVSRSVAVPVPGTWGGTVGRLGVALLALMAATAFALAHGPVPMGLATIAATVLHPSNSIDSLILWEIRLPRVCAAGLVGAGLAGAGVAMQALLRNPLADPYVVGASSGAGLGAVLTQVLFGAVDPFGAFVGALGAVLMTVALARWRGRVQVLTLLLAGYAVGVILAAVQVFLMLLNQENLATVFAWEAGGLHGIAWSTVGLGALLIAPAAVFLWAATPAMNALLLGEEQAGALGVAVGRLQAWLLVWASLLTAASVYLAGLVGFVGLVVPHVVRRWVGPDHRRLLPLAVLWGATFLILADTLAESLPALGTVPVGIVTAFLGGPYFLWLLLRTEREGVTF
jgi:iron complex transport system permease protein